VHSLHRAGHRRLGDTTTTTTTTSTPPTRIIIVGARRFCRPHDRPYGLDDEVAVEEALDRIGVLQAVAEDYDGDDVEGFKTRLSSLFGDGEDLDSMVTLATAHKFKGSEALRIWWLGYRRPDVTAGKHEWQRRIVAAGRREHDVRI
jgi:hypothetical protein